MSKENSPSTSAEAKFDTPEDGVYRRNAEVMLSTIMERAKNKLQSEPCEDKGRITVILEDEPTEG